MHLIWPEIYQSIQQGEGVVVATIVTASGSTPRTSGSRMVIYSDGRISGTIGGGTVEADVIQSGLKLFTTNGAVISSYNLKSSSTTNQMDLICGGWMQVLIEYVANDEQTIEMYRLLNNSIQASRPLHLIGRLRGKDKQYRLDRSFQADDGRWYGGFEPSTELLKEFDLCKRNHNATTLEVIDDQHYVIESLRPLKSVYLIGGGHLAKAISELLKEIDFRTIIIDDRPEFANKKRFSNADGVFVSPDYLEIFDKLKIDSDSYIIIITRGHRFDKEVLGQALDTGAGYIGMIGSRKKRDHIYRMLIEEGIESNDLNRVHCPVGLSINAETPAEIAVSIVAQLIQHRARQRTHG